MQWPQCSAGRSRVLRPRGGELGLSVWGVVAWCAGEGFVGGLCITSCNVSVMLSTDNISVRKLDD